MKDSPRKSEEGSPVGHPLNPKIPEEIEHNRGTEGCDESQGQATDGSDLLFELAGMAGLGGKVA